MACSISVPSHKLKAAKIAGCVKGFVLSGCALRSGLHGSRFRYDFSISRSCLAGQSDLFHPKL